MHSPTQALTPGSCLVPLDEALCAELHLVIYICTYIPT
jgi:hypothetical protein